MDGCERCGKCCSNLRQGNAAFGLTLFSDEIHLFPDDKIRPHIAKGDTSQKTVFTYQYTENVCLHLANNICKIYRDRPLICRSFPIKIGAYGLRFSPGCKAVLNNISQSKPMNTNTDEVKASIEIVNRLFEHHESFGTIDEKWIYNLEKENWERFNL